MTFFAPGALWALLALAIPLALHLRRRRVGPTIPVGSIRHLESLPTAERRGPRLRERRLLLLRALIVATLAALLARPVLLRPVSQAKSFALVDSAATTALIDSLHAEATVSLERLDDPWRRLQELDDSLPAGVAIIVIAPTTSDRFRGPRPTIARRVEWVPVAGAPLPHRLGVTNSQERGALSPFESKALAAAVAAAAEEFGVLTDSAGWMTRLPDWWRDSLAVPAFPLAVARAVAPARTGIPVVPLAVSQVLPRQVVGAARAGDAVDLHWWFWAAALLLFLLERAVALRWRGTA